MKDNCDLKVQAAADFEHIEQLRKEVTDLRQPFKLTEQQEELRDVKCQIYDVINMCQHQLISQDNNLANDLDIDRE